LLSNARETDCFRALHFHVSVTVYVSSGFTNEHPIPTIFQ